MERHGLTVEGDAPVCWPQRSHDLAPATTTAAVHCGSMSDGNVENAAFQAVWNQVDKLMGNGCH